MKQVTAPCCEINPRWSDTHVLEHAVDAGSDEALALLLAHGADVTFRRHPEHPRPSALHRLVKTAPSRMLRAMLNALPDGADVNLPYQGGYTVLESALKGDDDVVSEDNVRMLLAHPGIDPVAQAPPANRPSPVCRAMRRVRDEAILRSVSGVGTRMRATWDRACERHEGHVRRVSTSFLTTSSTFPPGASDLLSREGVSAHAFGGEGFTPMMYAAQSGNDVAVKVV